MEQDNNFENTNNQNVNEAKSELVNLGSNLQGQTSIEEQRKAILLEHMKDIKANHRGWLGKLMLSKEDRSMLRLYDEKQLEAAEVVLENQKESLKAICLGQVVFIREVVNTMLKTGRSGLKGAANAIYKENALAMQQELERINIEFYNLIEAKFTNAQVRLPFIQEQIMKDIKLIMQKWSQDAEAIQNDYSSILKDLV